MAASRLVSRISVRSFANVAARTETGDPFLLTPGPLTTSKRTKESMLHDWGSRDFDFIKMNQRIRSRLVKLVGAEDTHVAVLLQGSGTFTVEATLGTLIPRQGKALVLSNGAYGNRIAALLKVMQRQFTLSGVDESTAISENVVDEILRKDKEITHVTVVHCETSTGMLNPIERISEIVKKHNRHLIIDAMSTFGALEISSNKIQFQAVVSSANKCFEGVPGVGFALINRHDLSLMKGNAHSLSLDLHDQWQYTESTGQWRFTPPVHAIAAFESALDQHQAEGGVVARGARYKKNWSILVEHLTKLGLETYLRPDQQSPIIVTFHSPADPLFDFERFYSRLRDQGYVIYPGKLTNEPSFRIGCIGKIDPDQMQKAVHVIEATFRELGVTRFSRLAK